MADPARSRAGLLECALCEGKGFFDVARIAVGVLVRFGPAMVSVASHLERQREMEGVGENRLTGREYSVDSAGAGISRTGSPCP
jgi:hypothetical protein